MPGDKQSCAITGCGREVDSRGWCTAHYARWRRTGSTGTKPIGISGPLHPCWRGGDAAYTTVHNRLSRSGPARLHPCARCGEQAAEWAYDKADPDERLSPGGLPYSTDLNHYIPLCKPCHTYLDMPGSDSRPDITRRRALIRAELARDPKRTDAAISRICGTDHKTVTRVRQAVEASVSG